MASVNTSQAGERVDAALDAGRAAFLRLGGRRVRRDEHWRSNGGRVRRVVCRAFGPVDRLTLLEEPDPEPMAGEVVVAVDAAAVSFVDGLIVQGRYQVRPPLPPRKQVCRGSGRRIAKEA